MGKETTRFSAALKCVPLDKALLTLDNETLFELYKDLCAEAGLDNAFGTTIGDVVNRLKNLSEVSVNSAPHLNLGKALLLLAHYLELVSLHAGEQPSELMGSV